MKRDLYYKIIIIADEKNKEVKQFDNLYAYQT